MPGDARGDANVSWETILRLIEQDDLLQAAALARESVALTPEQRAEIERLAAHATSPEAYRAHYRDRMRGEVCPEEDLFTRHLLVKRFAGIRDRILARKQMRVLDLGCLDGWCLLNLAAGGIHGVGVDLSPEGIRVAQKRTTKYGFPLRFLCAAIEDLDLALIADVAGEESLPPLLTEFDAVLLSEVLEHVLDPAACFRAAARHLAPDGMLYVSTPATPIPHHGNLEDAALHLRVLSEERLRATAREAGLAAVVDSEEIAQEDRGQRYAHRTLSFRRARAAIYCNHVTGGWDPTDLGSLSASEEAVVRVAGAWAAAGHRVWVYQNAPPAGLLAPDWATQPAGEFGKAGVAYRPRGTAAPDDLDLIVSFKTHDNLASPARCRVFWTADCPAPGQGAAFFPPSLVENVAAVVCLSAWHRQQVLDACPWLPPERVLAHWVGIDPAEVQAARAEVPAPVPGRAVYASSLDRGALQLLQMWPRIREQDPAAELRVLYGLDLWVKSEGVLREPVRSCMQEQRQELERLLQQPGVTYLGHLSTREAYMRELASAAVWAYPCAGGELCCKTGLEAQALGVIPVVVPTMALAETVGVGYKAADLAEFEAALVHALTPPPGGRAAPADLAERFHLPTREAANAFIAGIPSWGSLAAFLWRPAAEALDAAPAGVPKPAVPEVKAELPERFRIPRRARIKRYELDVILHANGMPFDGETDRKASLGGSETAALQLSRALAKRGHRVTVFSNCDRPGKYEDVAYLNLAEFPRYISQTSHDVCILQRDPTAANTPIAGKLVLVWLHDLALHRFTGRARSSLWNVDYVVPVSHWHGRQVCQVYGLDRGAVVPMRNGIEAKRAAPRGSRVDRDRRSLVYVSRPERGLDLLLSAVFPRLLERDPGLTLYLAGYDNTVPEMRGFYDFCNSLCDGFGDRVRRLGALGKNELYALYRRAGAYVYPTRSFEEVFPLRGDALIDLPEGRVPIERLWREGRTNFIAYAWDHAKGRMTLARVAWVKRTRRNAEMVTLRFKWGLGCKAKKEGSLVLTPDHEVMLRDGSYRRADALRPGNRLMPFNRSPGWGRYKTADGRTIKYFTIDLNNGQRVGEHRFVMEQVLNRPLQPGEIVDHFDGNPGNNDPRNLQLHRSHKEHRDDHWRRLPEKESHRRRRKMARIAAEYHAGLSPEEMHAVKSRAARIGWERRRAAANHVVISVSPTDRADAYCLSVPDLHNFVANGIVVHNCITLAECAAAGLPFVGSDIGALAETAAACPGHARLVPHPGEPTEAYVRQFVDAVWEVISDPVLHGQMSRAGTEQAMVHDWERVAQEWEEFLLGAIEERSADRRRLVRHWWRMGDACGAALVAGDRRYPELEPDTPAEDAAPSVVNAVASIATQLKAKSIRPVCARSLPLARAVAAAAGAEARADAPADLVVGLETLDCDPDPAAHVAACEKLAAPGGGVCLVSAGPAVQEHRLHAGALRGLRWVFDQHDIRELLGKKRGLLALVIGGGGLSGYDGAPLSWNAYAWKVGSGPTGRIDHERRLALQAPRLSLTATMITHDAEGMLVRCLQSFRPYADEIVVADHASTDGTREILARFGATVVEGLDPRLHGFDAARNVVLPHVTGDMVLWIDSDEELLDGICLPKYLRWNMFGGYAVRQHHFSAVPEHAFKPDLPVRIFRRVWVDGKETGIKWWGCLAGETLISTPSGPKPIKDLVHQRPWVHCYSHEKRRITVERAEWVGQTRAQARILAIELDNGTIIRATEEHPFLLRRTHNGVLPGDYVPARNLKPGDRLMPLYRWQDGRRVKAGRRGGWFVAMRGSKDPRDEHRFVYQEIHGAISAGYDVHHINQDPDDNDPSNLAAVPQLWHTRFHHKNRRRSAETRARIRASHAPCDGPRNSMWNRVHSVETRAKIGAKSRERYAGFGNSSRSWLTTARARELNRWTWADPEIRRRRSEGIRRARAQRRLEQQMAADNHKVVAVRDGGFADVYNIQMPGPNHNFVAGGVVVHNCVHEHPETAVNASVGEAIALSDVHIAHTGYLTENIRRGRFGRNIRLMFRDRARHPDRTLGRMLMIRDWVHLGRYAAQQASGQMTPEAVGYFEAAIREYREHFLGKCHPLALDGLEYYREALLALGRGFDVEVVLKVAWPDGGLREFAYRGRVEHAADLRQLVTEPAAELGKIWTEKYL